MVSLSVGYPDFDSELSLAMGISETSRLEGIEPVLGGEDLREIQREICAVYLKESVARYLVELIRARSFRSPYCPRSRRRRWYCRPPRQIRTARRKM